ncbi:MAG TPA: hypothetical protein VNB90_15005 [Cytophagaceae bacterium]|nr:hypothetical protein [Cytophagaceae bacterium]
MDPSNQSNLPLLTGMFSDRESAENVYNTLREKGYNASEINLIMTEETRKRYFSGDTERIETIRRIAVSNHLNLRTHGGANAIESIMGAIETGLYLPGPGLLLAGPVARMAAERDIQFCREVLILCEIPAGKIHLYESGLKNGFVLLSIKPKNEEEAEFLIKNWKGNYGREIYFNHAEFKQL